MKFYTRLSIIFSAALLIAPLHGMDAGAAPVANSSIMNTVSSEIADLSTVALRDGMSTLCLRPFATPVNKFIYRNISDPDEAFWTTMACKMLLSGAVNAGLDSVSMLPKAPRASDWTHWIVHFCVSNISSHVVNSSLSTISHNLTRNYDKKNTVIPTSSKAMQVSNPLYFKDKDLSLDLNQNNSAFIYNHKRTIDRAANPRETKYTCTISQHKSRLIIDEKLMLKELNLIITTKTEYETRDTYWNYNIPWGIHRLRPAMLALKEKVMNHHITLSHVLLKSIF